MRFQSLGAFAGGLGLAALAAATPGVNLHVETCALANPSTVFVTVQSVTTVHDGPTSTVYVDMGEEPTTTLTSIKTLTRSVTTHTSAITNAALVDSPEHETTVYQTVYATATNYQVEAVSGASVTYSESAAPDGLFTFIVVNGTTFWLNGQTPAPSQSYVVETSVITVQPYNTPPPTSEDDDASTTTIRRTIFSTKPITLTETSVSASSSTRAASPTASAGTGSPSFTGIGPQGWNATSSAAGAFGTKTSTTSYHSLPTFSSGPPLTRTDSLRASSGFQVTESVIDPVLSSTSTAAPYANTTYVETTSSALGTAISAISTSCTDNTTLASSTSIISSVNATLAPSTLTLSPVVGVTSASVAATSTPLFNNTTSSDVSSTSSALGAFTSEVSTTIAAPNSTLSTFLGAPTSSSDPITNVTSLLPPLPSTSISSLTTSSVANFSTSEVSSIVASTLSTLNATIVASTASSTSDSSSVATSTLSSPSIDVSIVASTLSTSFTSLSSISLSATSTMTTMTSQTSSTVSSASATATNCGEVGDFVLNFDDIPSQDPNDTTANPMPVFNPYHQFDFSNGFVVVPPPTDPYLPSSKPLLTEFIPNFNISTATSATGPNAGNLGWSGDVGNGDHGVTGCFSFNAYGAAMGCDSLGPPCDFTFSGFRYNRDTGATNQVTQQSIAVAPCANLKSLTCELQQVTLDTTFQNLDKLRINVTVAGEPKIWWMDDLALGWYNNSCAAGSCRLYTHIY